MPLVRHACITPFDIILYSGWNFRSGFGSAAIPKGNVNTYLQMAWQEYFPKLLKPIGELYSREANSFE
jgi:hypothetical protein